MAKITFYGGALSVTGANYLIETKESKVLIDCGLIQGGQHCNPENYEIFPYKPSEISAVCITHAHIDHTGRLPKLFKEGFRGPIYATEPTAELSSLMLEDSQGIIEGECADKHGALYSRADVKDTSTLFRPQEYRKIIQITKDIRVQFRDAGHILGSAIIEMWIKEKDTNEIKIVFSGDLGNPPAPLLEVTEHIDEADYMLVETTYGNRSHENTVERKELLENAIEDTITKGGVLMIPVFALERTQEILFEITSLIEQNRIPLIPVFVDSPLAIDATRVYQKFEKYLNRNAENLIQDGKEFFQSPNLHFTYTTEESKKINEVPSPKVIIAGSGMSTGGRILHHERRYLSDPNSTILFVGYQGQGTLGRRIFDGASDVKIFGEEIPVFCAIRAIGGYSSHADQQTLYKWVDHTRRGGRLKKIFCVQGEQKAADAFATLVRDSLAVEAVVPQPGEVVEL